MKTLLLIATLLVSCARKAPKVYVTRIDESNRQEYLDLTDRIQDQELEMEKLQTELEELGQLVDGNKNDIDRLEQEINNNLARIIELEDDITVVEMIDPCGPSQFAYDEVLFKLSDGSIIAYFENGNNRFLTKIPDGDYRTTDQQRCFFSVDDGEVTW